jgi:hypothetical protein
MIQKIKTYIVTGVMVLMGLAPALAVSGVASACSGIAGNVASGAGGAAGSTITCNNSGQSSAAESSINSIAKEVVKIFSIVVGAASIFMIIYGGFRYITSGGASDKVGNAKNTLIYAIIGLIIVALAQLIVHFVLATPPAQPLV